MRKLLFNSFSMNVRSTNDEQSILVNSFYTNFYYSAQNTRKPNHKHRRTAHSPLHPIRKRNNIRNSAKKYKKNKPK